MNVYIYMYRHNYVYTYTCIYIFIVNVDHYPIFVGVVTKISCLVQKKCWGLLSILGDLWVCVCVRGRQRPTPIWLWTSWMLVCVSTPAWRDWIVWNASRYCKLLSIITRDYKLLLANAQSLRYLFGCCLFFRWQSHWFCPPRWLQVVGNSKIL